MKKFASIAVLVLALPAMADKFELKGDAAKGATKYKELCASCHGEKGDGAGPAGAAITPKPTDFTAAANAERLTDEYTYKVIKEGGAAVGRSPMMVAWGGIVSDQELRDVSAHVLKFKPGKAAAPAKKGK